MKKFDIVLVNFPFTDLSQTKLRPTLIVAEPRGNNILLCQITTKKRNINTFEVTLPQSSCSGDIRFDGNIYVDMLFTLHKDLIVKPIGTVKSLQVKKKVQGKLAVLFDLRV